MKAISGLADIAHAYDVYLIDLWGCVHNGATLFPNARSCLQSLRTDGRTVCLLSNAPRRVETVAQSLKAGFGLEQGEDYDHLMTSGEQTFCALKEAEAYGLNGQTFCYYGPDMNRGIVTGLTDWQETDIDSADCLIVAAPRATDHKPADAQEVLDSALKRNLPLICANPDLGVVVSDSYGHCAGAIAALYEGMGGRVIYFGKPHPDIYQTIVQTTGYEGATSRILAVGDGLKTDIRGANRLGCGGCLVSTGLISEALRGGNSDSRTQILELAQRDCVKPDWILQDLRWS